MQHHGNNTIKKFLFALLGGIAIVTLVLVCIFTFSATPTAYAQTGETFGPPAPTPAELEKGKAEQQAAQQREAGVVPASEWCNSASTCLSSVVYIFTVGMMSVFAYIGGYVFSLAVQLSLQSFAYSLDFLSTGWTAVRDIANMAFIFVLIYIAFTIIFEAETAGTMRMLAAVVVMALLINFSFFLTRVVIDAGNILAIQFYNAIDAKPIDTYNRGTVVNSIGAAAQYFSPGTPKDLTASIMDAIKSQVILSPSSFTATQGDSRSGVGIFLTNLITQVLIYIALGAILAILAFTFLAVGFKFIMRMLVLWFVIISAPLAFAARAIPHRTTRGLFDQWLGLLIKFSFYPAIFLFMFLIITFIATAIGSDGGLIGPIFRDATAMNNNADLSVGYKIGTIIANVVLRLGLVIIMLYYGLKVADKIVDEGTDAAKGFSNWVGRKVGTAAYGSTAWAARRTLAPMAYSASKSTAVKDLTNMSPRLGGLLNKGLKGVANSRLDIRQVPGFRPGILALGGIHGGDLGTPGKEGYIKEMETRAKGLAALAKDMKGDEYDIRKAQQKFDNDPTSEGRARKEEALLFEKQEAERMAADLEERAEHYREDDNMEDARQFKAFAAAAQKQAKDAETKLKALDKVGEKKVKEDGVARITALAKKLEAGKPVIGTTRSDIKSATEVWKVLKGKTTHEKTEELLKELQAEHGHDDHDGDDHPPQGGGGGGHGTGGGGNTNARGGGGGGNNHGTGGGHAHALGEQVIGDVSELGVQAKKQTRILERIERALEHQAEYTRSESARSSGMVIDSKRLDSIAQTASSRAASQVAEQLRSIQPKNITIQTAPVTVNTQNPVLRPVSAPQRNQTPVPQQPIPQVQPAPKEDSISFKTIPPQAANDNLRPIPIKKPSTGDTQQAA